METTVAAGKSLGMDFSSGCSNADDAADADAAAVAVVDVAADGVVLDRSWFGTPFQRRETVLW